MVVVEVWVKLVVEVEAVEIEAATALITTREPNSEINVFATKP